MSEYFGVGFLFLIFVGRVGRVGKGYRLRRALYSVLRNVSSVSGILKDDSGNGYIIPS